MNDRISKAPSTRPRVKICGLRTLAEAEATLAAGADFLGFNFYPKSPRYLEPARAAEIVRDLPAGVAVGLWVNPSRDQLLREIEQSGVAIVQLQGDEPPEMGVGLGWPVIKAFRLGAASDLERIPGYLGKIWAVLADAKSGLWGGSGHLGDWELSTRAKALTDRLFLAGGLTVDNIAAAVRAVRPWAVDVCSGVESAPGIKDLEKVRRFIAAARLASSYEGKR
jgi:phosphoribosylanthranilate isomerase